MANATKIASHRNTVDQRSTNSKGSLRSVGGLSIFQDPTAGSRLSRNEELNINLYDSVSSAGRSHRTSITSQATDDSTYNSERYSYDYNDNTSDSKANGHPTKDSIQKRLYKRVDDNPKNTSTGANAKLGSLGIKTPGPKTTGDFQFRHFASDGYRDELQFSPQVLRDDEFKSALEDSLRRKTQFEPVRDPTVQPSDFPSLPRSTLSRQDSDLTSVSSLTSSVINSLPRRNFDSLEVTRDSTPKDSSKRSSTASDVQTQRLIIKEVYDDNAESREYESIGSVLRSGQGDGDVNAESDGEGSSTEEQVDSGSLTYTKSSRKAKVGRIYAVVRKKKHPNSRQLEDHVYKQAHTVTEKQEPIYAVVRKKDTQTSRPLEDNVYSQVNKITAKPPASSTSTRMERQTGVKSQTSQEFLEKMNAIVARNVAATVVPVDSVKSNTRSEVSVSIAPTTYIETNAASDELPQVHSSTPLSHKEEMQSTINTGTVGSLVNGKFRDLNLTGRTVSLQHQVSTPSPVGTEGSTTEFKKYKFAVDGIDTPVVNTHEDPELLAVEVALVDATVAKQTAPVKRTGFNYVVDQEESPKVVRKTDDVTSKKPHETFEATQRQIITSRSDTNSALVSARASLKQSNPDEPRHKSLHRSVMSEIQQSIPKTTNRESNRVESNGITDSRNVKDEVVLPIAVEHRPSSSPNASVKSSSSGDTVILAAKLDDDATNRKATADTTMIPSEPKELNSMYANSLRQRGQMTSQPPDYSHYHLHKTKQSGGNGIVEESTVTAKEIKREDNAGEDTPRQNGVEHPEQTSRSRDIRMLLHNLERSYERNGVSSYTEQDKGNQMTAGNRDRQLSASSSSISSTEGDSQSNGEGISASLLRLANKQAKVEDPVGVSTKEYASSPVLSSRVTTSKTLNNVRAEPNRVTPVYYSNSKAFSPENSRTSKSYSEPSKRDELDFKTTRELRYGGTQGDLYAATEGLRGYNNEIRYGVGRVPFRDRETSHTSKKNHSKNDLLIRVSVEDPGETQGKSHVLEQHSRAHTRKGYTKHARVTRTKRRAKRSGGYHSGPEARGSQLQVRLSPHPSRSSSPFVFENSTSRRTKSVSSVDFTLSQSRNPGTLTRSNSSTLLSVKSDIPPYTGPQRDSYRQPPGESVSRVSLSPSIENMQQLHVSTMYDQPRSRGQRSVGSRRDVNGNSLLMKANSGMEMHPDALMKRRMKSYSLQQRQSYNDYKEPEDIAVDMHLNRANKDNNRYNVTLTLNAAALKSPARRSLTDMRSEEFVEENLYAPSYRPGLMGAPSWRSNTSDTDSGLVSPASRQKTNITLLESAPSPGTLSVGNSANVDHLQFRQYIADAPKVLSRDRSSTENYYFRSSAVDGGENGKAYVSSPRGIESGKRPKISMSIDQTMTMDYKHSEDDRKRETMQRKMDDMQNYLSPTEERVDTFQDGFYPNVRRGNYLITNSMDVTSPPKVMDIAVSSDSSDDDPVDIEENVNVFDGRYLQARENPVYSSDAEVEGRGKRRHKPKFARVFDDGRPEYDKDDYDTPIRVSRGPAPDLKQPISSHERYQYNGYNDASPNKESRKSSSHVTKSTEFEIHRLLKDAPPDSIRQTINVEREEEEIIGPLAEGDDDALLNFDTISENVELGMKEGTAQVAVKVRCERIVPIRGVADMFKKSSVIVTRMIEIDLTATSERQKLYEYIMNKNNALKQRQSSSGGGGGQGGGLGGRPSWNSTEKQLSSKDTFKLYKTFMGMAEADEQSKNWENIRIDRKVEEQRLPEVRALSDFMALDDDFPYNELDTDALEMRLEQQMVERAMRPKPEPDTISYMSALSETQDILY